MNITTPLQRTTSYQKSFYPQTIMDWNNLDNKIRNLNTLDSFKENLKHLSGGKANPLYLLNSTSASINQTRMRLGLSGLSYHRANYNHIKDPKCQTCGALVEDPQHFFLLCPTYETPRPDFLRGVCDILINNNIEIDFTRRPFRDYFIQTLLKGTKFISYNENVELFNLTQTFICKIHRFP
jgi:hypothetical protein